MNYKRCSLCGGRPRNNSKQPWRVNCSTTGCYQSENWLEYGMSIEDWNTRPIEDHLRSVIREAAAKLAGRPTNGNADIFNSLIADVFCDLCLEVDTWEATNGNDSDKPTNT